MSLRWSPPDEPPFHWLQRDILYDKLSELLDDPTKLQRVYNGPTNAARPPMVPDNVRPFAIVRTELRFAENDCRIIQMAPDAVLFDPFCIPMRPADILGRREKWFPTACCEWRCVEVLITIWVYQPLISIWHIGWNSAPRCSCGHYAYRRRELKPGCLPRPRRDLLQPL